MAHTITVAGQPSEREGRGRESSERVRENYVSITYEHEAYVEVYVMSLRGLVELAY